MATYIYARVSTDEQTVESQLTTIRSRYPDAAVVVETISGYKDKPALNALLARLVSGDILVVVALDRLGRHTRKALELIEDLNRRGVALISIREGLDMTTSTGKFVATCMLGLAEMERNLISERTKAGMARAKAEGKQIGGKRGNHGGRPRKIDDTQIQDIKLLRDKGLTISKISELTEVSTGRVCQLLKAV